MTELVHHLLTRGITAGQLIAQLAEMDPDNLLVTGDKGLTLSWLRVTDLDDETATAVIETDLTRIRRHLAGAVSPPGRPAVEKTADELGIDLTRTGVLAIVAEFKALTWPATDLAAAVSEGRR